ncbi:hypothetical protein, partial [Paracoccus sphaerophysae]|uniref:hypothetical protein n=1 Tax=Paracoccus sphaerophysae TaxID=690417 RepID=UPI0023584E80
QDLDIRARQIHPKSDPPDVGTEHLGREWVGDHEGAVTLKRLVRFAARLHQMIAQAARRAVHGRTIGPAGTSRNPARDFSSPIWLQASAQCFGCEKRIAHCGELSGNASGVW